VFNQPIPGELILIVEDEARIADLLERGLQAAGYRTERAATGRRALELWRAANPNLILLDLMIPEPGGLEVLSHIRRESEVADIAHELRTPLTVLKGKLEYLQDGLSQPTPQTLHRLAEEVDLLSRLVADLRLVSLADTDGLRLERCNLNLTELTREVMTAFERQAQNVGKHLQFEGEAVRLELDPERIQQVLYNLLDNALRHTPEGGTVRCTIRKAEQHILLEISDEGPGIPPADLERVFERLYRTDAARNREAGGSGLGLAIVRTLVEAHGGRVWVANRLEGGAVFTVSLPQTTSIS
jgi:two-component system, OmpR family, sensor histidine kinase BaeS